MYEVRSATLADLPHAKRLADKNKGSIGFVLLPALRESVERNTLIVAVDNDQVIGFINFRHRQKDDTSTLYEVCVDVTHRGLGVGAALVSGMGKSCRAQGKRWIQLKCPVDLPSNGFYERLGFTHSAIIPGKRRHLNVWKLRVEYVDN